jgi:hypothetical protein
MTGTGVRRDNAGAFQWVQAPPGDTLQPEAIGAGMEEGAPGIDCQDFADIEAYGVERWLAELALALRQETHRPEPIRRVFIPKANGKLRTLRISSVRDRVCMTAAVLVLEPIFEADLPSEIYAYRVGRNAQQAVVEAEELLFRGHPDVVAVDLADYFGSIPHTDLLVRGT